MIFYRYYIWFFFYFSSHFYFDRSVMHCTHAYAHITLCHRIYSYSLYRARPRQTDDCRNRLEEELLDTYIVIRHCMYEHAHHFHREKWFFLYFVPVGGSRALTSPLTKATVLTGYCPGNSARAHYILIMHYI